MKDTFFSRGHEMLDLSSTSFNSAFCQSPVDFYSKEKHEVQGYRVSCNVLSFHSYALSSY